MSKKRQRKNERDIKAFRLIEVFSVFLGVWLRPISNFHPFLKFSQLMKRIKPLD